MSLVTSSYSLVEQSKRIDPNGEQAQIAEVLNRKMGNILAEWPWMMSNDVWTNKTVRRGTLNTGTRRKLNQRITASVSRTTETMDVIETIADYCEVDKDIVKSMPSEGVFLSGEVDAFMEGIGQTLVSDVLYADSNADPDAMHGLAARMSTIDGRFVIDEGGTGSDVTSIYLVTPGTTDVYFIYPRNMEANKGIIHEDKGYVTSETSDGLMEIHRDYFVVRCGMVVRNPRALGRLANIETSGTTNTFDEDNLIALCNNCYINANSRLYANETIITQMEIALKDKNNVNYSPEGGEGLAGQPMIRFRGIPIRRIDREILLNTETAIS